MITAISAKNKVIVSVNSDNNKRFILERKKKGSTEWEVLTDSGFVPKTEIESENKESLESEQETNETIETQNNETVDF